MKYLVNVSETVHYQQMEVEADNEEQAEEKYMDMLSNGYVLDVNQEYMYPQVYPVDKNGETHKLYCKMCSLSSVTLDRPVNNRTDFFVCKWCRENNKMAYQDNTFTQEHIISET